MSLAKIHLRMNKVDLQLEHFMKSAEHNCHKYKCNIIKGLLYVGAWICRWWLLGRVAWYLSGKTKDPCNLFREFSKHGVKDPQKITTDGLRTEFVVRKQNIATLEKNGPYFCLQFLKSLVVSAREGGDTDRVSTILGIIQKENMRKRWRRINRSTRKARGSLTVAMKVPTVEGGFDAFKTKRGIKGAVSPIILERFQSALVAPCHQGTFFEDVGILVDGPVSQQILEGTYDYPLGMDPATRLLFEEAAHTYKALSPTEIAIYVTPDDFQHFWQTARERTGSSYSGLHFGHYVATSFCPDLSLLHAAKLSICVRNGVTLAQWGKGLTVLLEKILRNVFVHKLQAICLLEADFH
jgi:hypothetical protein